MGSLRGLALAVIGGVAGTVAVAALVVGCGDDNGGGQQGDAGDGAPDAIATDGRAEAASDVALDTRTDGTVDASPDAGPDSTVDALPDTTPDVVPDRAVDALPDVARDAGPDVASDAPPDVTPDVLPDVAPDVLPDVAPDVLADVDGGPNAIEQYATAYGEAFCAGQGKCCPGYPAAFDQASCAAAWSTLGWESTLPANAAAYTAGHLVFNATQGAACLAALQGFACTTGGTVTAAQYAAVTSACLNVLTGTIPNGTSGCVSSFECANGYCAVPDDGGTGTCTALVGNAGTCAPGVDSQDEMCSQVGTYQPALWCNRLAGGTTGTCAAPLADTVNCFDMTTGFYSDYGCTSLMCGDLGCGGTSTYPTPGFCTNWPIDAGGGD